MPIELRPFSRRQFLRGSVGFAAIATLPHWLRAGDAQAVDPNLLALCSDTHLHADRGKTERGINMWDHFARVTREIIALPQRPAAVLINGDCALADGRPSDYQTVIAAVQPLREAQLPVHLTLGNHDDRGNFLDAIPNDEIRQAGAVGGRVVSRLRLPRADVYLLDSLDKVNATPGVLGKEQLAWLGKSLDAAPDRPAVVVLHHPLDFREVDKRGGLIDTEALVEVVKPRRQVKALLYGHRHFWEHAEEDGLHLVHLPTTAYLFRDHDVAGWVEARFGEKGMTLKLNAITPNHELDGQVLGLGWR